MKKITSENESSTPPTEPLPSPSELTTWTWMAYPHAKGNSPQDQILNAQAMALFAWKEALKRCRTQEQIERDLQFGLEHFHHITLVEALSYLHSKGFSKYKTVDGLRKGLLERGIPIHDKTSAIADIITGESITMGENIMKPNLKKFMDLLRAEKRSDQRDRRERENS
jgi:hypothetical protein